MRAEIISIGDELTTGQRLDTNSQWLSQQLTQLGVEVAFHTTVGDQLVDNVAVFRTALERVDVLISTGGLGPTADDLTRSVLAEATGTTLYRDAESLAHIERIFASRGRTMPERNCVQADFPRGAKPIPNQHGTAPGIEMTFERSGRGPCHLFALPGVPVEMHEMWANTVAPRILAARPEPQVTRHRCIKCFGVGESQLEAMLPDLIRRGRQPRVGITVSDATITLRITATATDESACLAAMEPTVAVIRESLGDLVFGEGDDELEHVVLQLLANQDKTLAVAEWATEGQITQWLAALDPGQATFVGGEVITDEEQLVARLAPATLTADTAPHDPAVAAAMAEMVRANRPADFGLAVAAYPADPFQAESRVQVAIASSEGTQRLRFGCPSHPAILQSRTAKQALNALRLILLRQHAH